MPYRPMEGAICFIWVHIILLYEKQGRSLHPRSDFAIAPILTWEGDEIRRRSSNFVSQWKKRFSRHRHWLRLKWLWSMPRPILYRLQYRKKLWGNQNKVRQKKIFSPKSMTKLEDLTVLIQGYSWWTPGSWDTST